MALYIFWQGSGMWDLMTIFEETNVYSVLIIPEEMMLSSSIQERWVVAYYLERIWDCLELQTVKKILGESLWLLWVTWKRPVRGGWNEATLSKQIHR